ncbi:hypothetical protein DM01DRAFT_1407762 [Hesseltinella vesiculosa]|uniref:Mitochondrial distribution and morphology protein 12 n=1 Tax=Hesseltinella vesiculosa TaxID=101127 RepID=A0A1X2GH79_9FUNG|nr:hypothetical protein DM01DRAFT_1407762 [Hesseltinella vesiculosa]
MSFDIEWNKLDDELAGHVQAFLNRHFQTINKPSFIGDIQVTHFGWGNTAPSVEIIDITDPFPDFYEPDEENDDDMDNDASKATAKPASKLPSPEAFEKQSLPSQRPSFTASRLSLAPSENDSFYDTNQGDKRFDRMSFPLAQQQRIQLNSGFHRSPLVAPQHPFSSSRSTPGLFSPVALSPTNSMYFDQPPAISDHVQDWIDDELLHSAHSTTTTVTNSAHPSNKSSALPASSTTPSPAATAASVAAPALADDPATRMDFQAHLLISYKGDMNMTILTELRMNYPSMVFMSLPIQLKVRSVEFESTAVVAYIQSMRRICCSLLDNEDEETVSIRGKDVVGPKNLLQQVHIESVVGDKQKHVLKNVGKIERFIVEQLRKMLDDELVYPSHQVFLV